jgi:hypothetical protein
MVRYENTFSFLQYYFPIKKHFINLTIKFKNETQLMEIINGHYFFNKKYNYPHMSRVHMFTTSSLSKDP